MAEIVSDDTVQIVDHDAYATLAQRRELLARRIDVFDERSPFYL